MNDRSLTVSCLQQGSPLPCRSCSGALVSAGEAAEAALFRPQPSRNSKSEGRETPGLDDKSRAHGHNLCRSCSRRATGSGGRNRGRNGCWSCDATSANCQGWSRGVRYRTGTSISSTGNSPGDCCAGGGGTQSPTIMHVATVCSRIPGTSWQGPCPTIDLDARQLEPTGSCSLCLASSRMSGHVRTCQVVPGLRPCLSEPRWPSAVASLRLPPAAEHHTPSQSCSRVSIHYHMPHRMDCFKHGRDWLQLHLVRKLAETMLLPHYWQDSIRKNSGTRVPWRFTEQVQQRLHRRQKPHLKRASCGISAQSRRWNGLSPTSLTSPLGCWKRHSGI